MLKYLILLFVLLNISLFAVERDYPPEWWEDPQIENPPSWEILPHEAGPGEVILSKRTELGILSNFAATPFTLNRKKYASLEGFWQMMKYPENRDDPRAKYEGLEWPFTRREIAKMVGFEAKKAGKIGSKNMEIMGINWVSFEGRRMTYRTTEKGEHYDLIYKAMWKKVLQNKEVKRLLLATGDLVLMPDHKQKDPPPAWQYHKIWMKIRSILQKGE